MTLVPFCTAPEPRQYSRGTIYAHGPPQFRALLPLSNDFLIRYSELIAISIDDFKFTPDEALDGMIRKNKTN